MSTQVNSEARNVTLNLTNDEALAVQEALRNSAFEHAQARDKSNNDKAAEEHEQARTEFSILADRTSAARRGKDR